MSDNRATPPLNMFYDSRSLILPRVISPNERLSSTPREGGEGILGPKEKLAAEKSWPPTPGFCFCAHVPYRHEFLIPKFYFSKAKIDKFSCGRGS